MNLNDSLSKNILKNTPIESTSTHINAGSDRLDLEYTTCISSGHSSDGHGMSNKPLGRIYDRTTTYHSTTNQIPIEYLYRATASNHKRVSSAALKSSAMFPISTFPTTYWLKNNRYRRGLTQKKRKFEKIGVTHSNVIHSTKLFKRNALGEGISVGLKKMCKDNEMQSLDPEKNKSPLDEKCLRSAQSNVSIVDVNMLPEKIDIYYFDHGTLGYYLTTDIAPILLSDKCIDKVDNAATRFWAEIFGTINIGVTFIMAFVLQLWRFILRGIMRPLIIGIIQMIADYAFKPTLTIIFNGVIQPMLIFLYNIATSFRDVCLPIAQSLGYFLTEFANFLRAIRLVEINPKSVTNNHYPPNSTIT